MPSKFGNARTQSDPCGESRRAAPRRPSNDKAELQTIDKVRVVRERDLTRTVNIAANIEFAFTLLRSMKRDLFNVIARSLSPEKGDYPFFSMLKSTLIENIVE